MRRREPFTLQAIVEDLPAFGSRRAVGLRDDLGLRWWTYERLHRHARRAAALLRDHGVGKGDRILIRGPNSPEWAAFFFGAMLRGAVVVPLDYDSPPALVRRIAAAVTPRLFVTSDQPSERTDVAPFLELNALHADLHSDDDDRVAVSPSDAAIIFYTSGTTSTPRGVVLTHSNVVAQVAAFRRWRPLARAFGARMLVMAPLSHAQGLVLGIAIPLSLGLSVIYTSLNHPAHLVRVLRDNRVHLFSTVPRVLHMLAKILQSQPYGRGPETLGEKLRVARRWIVQRHYAFTHTRRAFGCSFWVVLVGGAPLPQADEYFWRISGCRLVQGYGLTETAAIVSVNFPLVGRFGSVGKPLGDQEVRLTEEGEILVRGPNVTPSYFGEADKSDTCSADGFLRTGDIGRLDKRNRLFVLGRKKDVIVTGEGFNVHGSDVEAVLNQFADVEDAVVVGLERDGHAQVHAVLLLRESCDAAGVVALANQELLAHQRIRSWSIWPERDFPRTTLLKPKRGQIVERISRTPIQDKAPESASLDAIRSIEDRHMRIIQIARYIATGGPEGNVDANLSLARDIGLSSLDTVELLALVEQQTGRALDGAVDEAVTVAELQDLIRNPSRERRLGALYASNSPRWPELGAVRLLRRVVSPPILNTIVHMRTRLRVSGVENLASIKGPVIFAGAGHEHGLDVLLIYSALPPRLRKRLAAVTSRWVFTHYLDPEPGISLAQRFVVGLGFRVLVPLFFPFVLSAPFVRSRDTLMDACRLIDRGYSLVAFDGRGMAAVALQSGVPIVPVLLGTSPSTGFRPRLHRADVSIAFEPPIATDPTVSIEALTQTLGKLYERPLRGQRG